MNRRMPVLAALERADAFEVQQKKEWGEILTGWETKNRYEVRPADGGPPLYAGEVGGGAGALILRQFLGGKRPFSIEVKDPQGGTVLVVRRGFTFFFARAAVEDGEGRPLGAIRQRWAFFARRYTVEDADGAPVAELHGPVFKPWTFNVRVDGREAGKIAKKWSGALKEAFTDADRFTLEVGPDVPPALRALLLGATFLIDFVHFERSR